MAEQKTIINSESTLQDVLNFQYSAAGGSLRSIIIRNRKGDCKIKPNINVRFYNCNFTSFNCTTNNTLFFRNCVFKGEGLFNFEGASIIIDDNTVFEVRSRFKNSSIQLLKSKIYATQVYTNVQLSSFNSIWSPKDSGENSKVGIIAKNSRIISIGDRFSKWDNFFINATEKTFIKLDKVEEIDTQSENSSSSKGFLNLKDSTAEIWDIKKYKNITEGKDPLIKLDKSSLLIKSNISLKSDYILFDAINSSIVIDKAITLSSTKNSVFNTKDSSITLNNIEEISTQANDKALFLSKGTEVFNLNNIKEIKSVSKLFDFEKATININGNKTNTLQSQNDLVMSGTDTSSISINNIDSIKALNSSLFNIKNSNVNIQKINTLESGARTSYVLFSSKSNISFSKVDSIVSKGNNAFQLENESNLSLLDIKEVKGSTGAALKILSKSKVLCKNVKEISGDTEGILLENSSCVIKDTFLISGSNLAIKGTNSKATLINVETFNGDIEGTNFDINILSTLPTTPTVLNKITLTSNVTNMKEAIFKGPMTVGEASFINYIINSYNTRWSKDITLNGSTLINNINSVFENISLTNSVLFNIKSNMKSITSTNSVINILKGITSDLSLSDLSTLVGYSSNIPSVSLANSGAFLSATSPGTVTLAEKSSFVGLALNNISPSFASDPLMNGVGFFINSGGNLGLQADSEIISEANIIREKARAEIVENAISKVSSIVGSTSSVLEPTQINFNSITLIKLTASTTITLDATTVNI